MTDAIQGMLAAPFDSPRLLYKDVNIAGTSYDFDYCQCETLPLVSREQQIFRVVGTGCRSECLDVRRGK
jgi:hypothetical protein